MTVVASAGVPVTEAPEKTDWLLGIGMSVVVAAAAVASFAGLRDLALITGWHPRLAWLLPLCVDAYAMTATRVWLAKSTRNEHARSWAKWNAIGAIACSVAGNAVDHALNVRGGVAWPLVVAVSAVPPIVLGLLVHLAHLRRVSHTVPAVPAAVPAVDPRGPEESYAPAEAEPPAVRTARSRAAKSRTAKDRTVAGPGRYETAMRALWDTERAAGRTPSGADLNRVAGLDPNSSTGRKACRRYRTEETSPAETTGPAATAGPVPLRPVPSEPVDETGPDTPAATPDETEDVA